MLELPGKSLITVFIIIQNLGRDIEDFFKIQTASRDKNYNV